ncbi:single-stranded DNA-binding protein [Listeria ivanovii]|uniref:Single-stranded DNA-binding protein n=2 Tax=Listeria ivanovii TaxID=1638 RepID=A0ABS1G281_LISIV|nr:single-stranded DNA-binding protein [Listeria ivanovii]AIS58544.1 single-stranded DNA-binding protein [Listeria ivanovii subsp. londoniensis]AIS61298.1 single-stranded DNA-binding protein [Listeria ivanovii subsp. londoniensis]MBC2255488.1 single-stranded DNA-binding protein [Listeria ivanovii]MBK1960934.1 single-stranded DNA-binding protein [Listeria ivanovii subsp. londoniensis]MBK1966177.1 single-stranded DNA-binding protein [Listeria ivanovii subsp. londoniensis]
MMNRVVLVGRLTKDPELRYTPAGVAVATFTLAVNRTFTNQQGEREADFINCVVWRKPAENVANFLKKGSMAGVDGRVQTRNYEGNDGKRVYVTEIVAESVQFLEPRNSSGGGGNNYQGGNTNNNSNYNNGGNNFGQAPTNNGGFAQDQQQSQNQNYQSTNNDPFASDGKPIDISDDDLPF